MAVRIDVVEDGAVVKDIAVENTKVYTIVNNTTKSVSVKEPATPPHVVTVLKGQPGVSNVYVGPTPPPNPFENMIWIDTSAG